MKLSDRTFEILRNFAKINKSIRFQPGQMLTTISTAKSIWAKVTVAETFEKEFGIYDLNKFLGVLDIFPEIEDIEVGTDRLTVINGKQRLEYRFADLSVIVTPPSKEFTLPPHFASFELPRDQLEQIKDALKVLHMHDVLVVGDKGRLFVKISDLNRRDLSDVYTLEVGATDQEFDVRFRDSNLLLMDSDYTVELYQLTPDVRIGKFVGKDAPEYFICTESTKA